MPKSKPPKLDAGGGFSLASNPDRVPLKKGEYSVASRALGLTSYFLSGALAVNFSQFLGTPLYLINQDWYNAWIAFTKQSFGLLTMTLTSAFAPTKVIVSGDKSVRGQLLKTTDGQLLLDFPQRLVLISNHQIYTDWMYLWWIAYCNGMHGRLFIILKESLKRIPVLGWGMQFSQFIFLKRNWEKDKPHMAQALHRLNKAGDAMWLLLFPEGTNLAPNTRERSAAWAAKNGIADMRHLVLPRSTGLHFCLEELKNTVDYVYDCTVAYEGVKRGQYAQDIYTLKESYLEGRPPKSVSMYWRRFAIKDIPIHNDKAFENWLMARWREKDALMETYMATGSFPADNGSSRYPSTGKVIRGCGHLEVQIRPNKWYEFLQIFAPMGALAMVLYTFYGALPQRFWRMINHQALKTHTDDLKTIQQQAGGALSKVNYSTLDAMFDADRQEDTFKQGAMAVQSWLNSPSAQKMMSQADLVSKWLEDPQKVLIDTVTGKTKQNFLESLQIEEAKRAGQKTIKPSKKSSKGKGTFWKELENVEAAKQGNSASLTVGKPKGNFWKELEAVEGRKGSVTSTTGTTRKSASNTNFYDQLKAAEAKKNNTVSTRPAKNVNGNGNGNFWDKVKKEENTRFGSVNTVSSGSTAVSSTRSASTTAAGSTVGSKKAVPLGPPKKSPLKQATTNSAPPKLASSASSTTSPPKLDQKAKPVAKPVMKATKKPSAKAQPTKKPASSVAKSPASMKSAKPVATPAKLKTSPTKAVGTGKG